ncbi:MAG: RNA-directed DNA polymerase [Nanoarchaeota archaeon]
MPLGNLTSQFFANIYLNELDYYVKYDLGIKYYIRYVDDFVILNSSKEQLQKWKEQIDEFLREQLKIELHPPKSRIISLSKGIDFVGFRNFYHHRLVRKRNIRKMEKRINSLRNCDISYWELMEIYQGWQAYVKWADSFKLRKSVLKEIHKVKEERLRQIRAFRGIV